MTTTTTTMSNGWVTHKGRSAFRSMKYKSIDIRFKRNECTTTVELPNPTMNRRNTPEYVGKALTKFCSDLQANCHKSRRIHRDALKEKRSLSLLETAHPWFWSYRASQHGFVEVTYIRYIGSVGNTRPQKDENLGLSDVSSGSDQTTPSETEQERHIKSIRVKLRPVLAPSPPPWVNQ